MKLSWKRIAILVIGAIALAVVVLFLSGTTQVAHEALQYQLQAIGQSIYEYHANTGQWPSGPGDIEKTSFGLRLRYWEPALRNGSIVIVWHNNLQANPRDNANLILAYHNRGLLADMGRQWVCWGDLRTEYISSRRLEAILSATAR